jgi:hypothetical protein
MNFETIAVVRKELDFVMVPIPILVGDLQEVGTILRVWNAGKTLIEIVKSWASAFTQDQ